MRTLTITVFLLLSSIGLWAQIDFDSRNLFYCNSNTNIRRLFIVSDTIALGVIENTKSQYYGNRGETGIIGAVKETARIIDRYNLLLFKRGVPIDTLLGINIPINMVPLGNDNYWFNSIGSCYHIMLKNNKLNLIDATLPFKPLERWQVNGDSIVAAMDTSSNYIDKQYGYSIGYLRYDKKNRDHIRNWPQFFVEDVETKHRIVINPREKQVTKDHFTKQQALLFYNANHSFHDGKIYFSVPSVNKCYVFDTKTKQTSFFHFPDIKAGQACFYYYDYMAKRDYVVRKRSERKYEVFLRENGRYIPKAVLDFYPYHILGGKAQKVEEVKEDGRKFTCYYWMPLWNSSEQGTLLEEVEIK